MAGSENAKDIDKIKDDAKSVIRQIVDGISNSSSTKQLVIGTASGWTTGYVTMKVGKTAALAVGGGIILLQIAQQKGYVTIDWNKVKEKAEKSTEKVENKYSSETSKWIKAVKNFAKDNSCFAAGFIGGFLIGLAH